MRDDDGVVFPMYIVQMNRAQALSQLERWDEAAQEITPVATEEAHDEAIWALVAESYWRIDPRRSQPCSANSSQAHQQCLWTTSQMPHRSSDAVLEAMFDHPDRRASVFALAVRVTPQLSVERAAEWSVRMRQAGLEEHCPLIAMSNDMARDFLERLQAAGLTVGALVTSVA